MHALGYHITFHPYGLWLPGDPRGWTDRRDDARSAPHREPSPALCAYARRQMSGPAFELSAPRRSAVMEAIPEACAWRAWVLHALRVQVDHVHVVVSAADAPEEVMRVMKSRATRHLRETGLAMPDDAVWARHGSTRYLLTLARLHGAIRYVGDHYQPPP